MVTHKKHSTITMNQLTVILNLIWNASSTYFKNNQVVEDKKPSYGGEFVFLGSRVPFQTEIRACGGEISWGRQV